MKNYQPCEINAKVYGIMAGLSAIGGIASGIVATHEGIGAQAQNIFSCASAGGLVMTLVYGAAWMRHHGRADRFRNGYPKGELSDYLSNLD